MNFVMKTAGAMTAALLVACGGGGGDDNGGPAPSGGVVTPGATPGTNTGTPTGSTAGNTVIPRGVITSNNYVSIAQNALGTNAYLLSASSVFVGAEIIDSSVLMRFTQEQITKLPTRLQNKSVQAVGVIETDIEMCDGGGNVELSYNDVNNNGTEDTGDIVSITARNCSFFGVALNGKVTLTLTRTSGDPERYPYSASVAAAYTNFSGTDGNQSFTGNGSANISITQQSENDTRVIVSYPSFTTSTVSGALRSTVTVRNYEVSFEARNGGGQETYTSRSNGTLIDSSFNGEIFDVRTTNALVRRGSQPYASQGQVVVTDSKGGKVRATVKNETTVTLELDADGNNSYESSIDKPWSELL